MLATHFAAFCNPNVNRESLLQRVIAVILAFVVKDHNGIWVWLIKSLLACTISFFSFAVDLYAYREFSLYVFIDLYKFYCNRTFKIFLSQINIHVALFNFIFHLQYYGYDFYDLVNLLYQIHLSIWCMALLKEFLINGKLFLP